MAQSALQVDVTYVPHLSWALAFNGLQVVRQVRLHHTGQAPLPHLTVRAEVAGLTDTPAERQTLGLPPDATLVIDDLDLRLSEAELAAVTEGTSVSLRVEVAGPDGVVHEQTLPARALPWDHWDPAVLPELLAAHCRPMHPEAAALSEPLNYARADPFDVADRLRVLHEHLAGLALAAVPFDGGVRSPDAVLAGKQASDLEAALWMAAALEASGLHALVAVCGGTALVGVWGVDHHLPFPVSDDLSPVQRRLDTAEVFFIAATPGLAYGAAKTAARDAIAGAGVVYDITAARKAGIRPLPLRFDEARPEVAVVTEPRSERLERWKARLLDLSMRNRLLNCKDSKGTLPLLVGDVGRLEDHLHEGERFAFEARVRKRHAQQTVTTEVVCPWCATRVSGEGVTCSACGGPLPVDEDQGNPLAGLGMQRLNDKVVTVDLSEGELDRRLRNLYRSAHSQLQETGANTLYVAIGLLRFYETSRADKPRTAPLLLMPVQITRKSVRTGYSLSRTDDEIVVNPTLLQYLHQVHGFDALRLAELPTDEHGVDVQLVLRRFQKLVQPKERWGVVDAVWITQLSFTRHMMWLDLETRTGELMQNLVVRQLLSDDDTVWPQRAEMPAPDTLDDAFDVADVLCPLDADSSQLSAIFAAEAGNSFVLQGPPGTGKSQTITNLIAHALAHGRTVLFVSEKMAALEVVHGRLSAIGLAPFCLELHSNKSRKADVIRQLQEAFDAAGRRSKHDWKAHAAELQQLRDQLAAYVKAAHQPGPLGLSAYQATSQLVVLQGRYDVPRIDIDLGPPDALNADEYQALRGAVDALSALAQDLDAATSPWQPVGWTTWHADRLPTLRAGLAKLDTAAAALQTGAPFDVAVDRDTLHALGELAGLLPSCPGPTEALVTASGWAAHKERIRDWMNHGRHRAELWSQLAERFTPAVLELPLKSLHEQFAGWSESFAGGLFLYFARQRLSAVAVGALGDNPAVRDDLALALQVAAEDAWLAENEDDAKALLGPFWAGTDSDFDAIEQVAVWVDRFRTVVARVDPALRDNLQRQVSQTPEGLTARSDLPTFARGVAQFAEARDALASLLDLDETCWNQANHLASVRARVRDWRDAEGSLREWVAWNAAVTRLQGRGLGAVVTGLLEGRFAPEDLLAVLTRAVLTWWLDAWTGAHEALRTFRGVEQDRRIARFRQLDNEGRRLALEEVRARLAANVPTPGAASHGEMGVLNRELRKKRSHLPVRQLFDQIPNVLQRIKPCVLMSPLSVAQYLDPALDLFDLVVFDEASQIPPWEAIGAMARGRQVVVVGDSKQLPPTSFFRRGDDDPMDEEARKDLESILDECLAIGMPALTLDWHYRSQHEGLIAFSNRHYYANRLVTFPCARADAEDLGVQLRYCEDGVYDKGRTRTNPVEAAALVADVVATLSDPSHTRSVGIVTFSMPQQHLIEDLLDEARRTDPELERWFGDSVPEPVFVKNLENVQGDERDVIYFSVCYGPDADDKISMNFGPLNRQGGERRLNVAITRARMALVLFTSLTADRIDLTRTGALGVAHLRDFLRYAELGDEGQAVADHPAGPLADEIAARLIDEGYDVDALVGASAFRVELAVRHPDDPTRYLLAVETDGPVYAAAPSTRDRDRLRTEVLGRLGWSTHRVWATEWLRDPERCWTALAEALAEAKVAPPPEAPPPVALAEFVDTLEAEEAEEAEEAHPTYVLAEDVPGPATDGQTLYHRRAEPRIREAIQHVLDVEAPLHIDDLTRRVGAAWGVTRLTAKPRRRVHELVEGMDATLRQGFVWRADQDPASWDAVRVPGASRDADKIPPEEVAAAVAFVLGGAISSTRDALALDAARVLGYGRLGKKVRAAMDAGIALLIERGTCVADGDLLTLKR